MPSEILITYSFHMCWLLNSSEAGEVLGLVAELLLSTAVRRSGVLSSVNFAKVNKLYAYLAQHKGPDPVSIIACA